jgi:hypothetical protein
LWRDLAELEMAKDFELLSTRFQEKLMQQMKKNADNPKPSSEISDPLLRWLAQSVELTHSDWKLKVRNAPVPTDFGAQLKTFLKRLRDVYVEGSSSEHERLPDAFWPWLALVLHPPPRG